MTNKATHHHPLNISPVSFALSTQKQIRWKRRPFGPQALCIPKNLYYQEFTVLGLVRGKLAHDYVIILFRVAKTTLAKMASFFPIILDRFSVSPSLQVRSLDVILNSSLFQDTINMTQFA